MKLKEKGMPKFFVNSMQIYGDKIEIIGKDVKHIKNVLRKKINDEIIICNQDNMENFLCTIVAESEQSIVSKVVSKLESNTETNVKVTIFQGIPKADKMELIIQKSVELGAFDITPVAMKRCVVKLDEKDKSKKLERWQKIAEVAAKQCGRSIIPQINDIVSVKNICNLYSNYDIVILAYEKEECNSLRTVLQNLRQNRKYIAGEDIKIGVIIGPEGGIDEDELEQLKDDKLKVITLGKRILRTETVALAMLSIIMYELDS